MAVRLRKDVREVVKYAEQYGFELAGIRKSGHIRLTHANGHSISLSASPSCPHFRRNAQADVRRYSRA